MGRPIGIPSHRRGISMEQEYGLEKALAIKSKISNNPKCKWGGEVSKIKDIETFRRIRSNIQTKKYLDPEYKTCQLKLSCDGGFSEKHSKETKEKMSLKRKELILNGKFPSKFFPSIIVDSALKVRSRYEANFVRLLKFLNISFEYESKRCVFNLGNSVYICDFYLPDLDVFIELKTGKSFNKHSLSKPIQCIQRYPNISLKILDREGYLNLESKYKNYISSWEDC